MANVTVKVDVSKLSAPVERTTIESCAAAAGTLAQGTLVGRNAAGYFVKGDDAVILTEVGVHTGPTVVVDSALADAVTTIPVTRGIVVPFKIATLSTAAAARAAYGKKVFALYNNEVALSGTEYSNFVGHIVGHNSVTEVLVEIPNADITASLDFPTYTDSADILSSGSAQGTREQSATQNYPLGMKRVYPDGRIFRYVYARTALHSEVGACYAAKTIAVAVAPTQGTGIGVTGAFTVKITVGNSDGLAGNGVVSVNELAGGYVVIGNGTSQHPMNRRIVSNTVAASNLCILTLDEALEGNVTAQTTTIETLMNPWMVSDMYATNSGYTTARGVPAREITSTYYGFVQTAGPCWITSNSNTCNSEGDRQIYFVSNGSVVSGDEVTGDVNVLQLAGHAIDMSGNGESNAPFVNLCLEVS